MVSTNVPQRKPNPERKVLDRERLWLDFRATANESETIPELPWLTLFGGYSMQRSKTRMLKEYPSSKVLRRNTPHILTLQRR